MKKQRDLVVSKSDFIFKDNFVDLEKKYREIEPSVEKKKKWSQLKQNVVRELNIDGSSLPFEDVDEPKKKDEGKKENAGSAVI